MAVGEFIPIEKYRLLWRKKIKPNQRLVLFSLLRYESSSGEIYPAVARVAYDTGYSENSITDILKQLEKLGVLIRTGITNFGVVIYCLDLDVLLDKENYISKTQKRRLQSKEVENEKVNNNDYGDEIPY